MQVLNESEFRKKLRTGVDELCKVTGPVRDGMISSQGFYTKKPLQTIVCLETHDIFLKTILIPIVFDACINAEKIAGNSAELCLNLILTQVPHIFGSSIDGKHDKKVLKLLNDRFEFLLKATTALSQKTNYKIIKRYINDSYLAEDVKDMIKATVDLAGKNSQIKTLKSKSSITSIQLREGYNFSLQVNEAFLNSKNMWSHSQVECCVIDGIVEKISEIHHLLQKASESKTAFVLFARDFSEDVLYTIIDNFKRGTINVLPVCVPLNDYHVNTLVDIAVACNTDVISSIKGELISSSLRSTLPFVDKIEYSKGNISIYNESAAYRVRNHIDNLETQISDLDKNDDLSSFDESSLEAIVNKKRLLNLRMLSLNNRLVLISIGADMLSKHKNIIEDLDSIFREITSLISYGVINKKDLYSLNDINFIDFIEAFQSSIQATLGNRQYYSTASIAVSLKFSLSAIKSLCSIGCVLFYNE